MNSNITCIIPKQGGEDYAQKSGASVHGNCIDGIVNLDLNHGCRGDQVERTGNDSEKSSRQRVEHIAPGANADHA